MTTAPLGNARSHRTVETRLGSYVLAAEEAGLVGIWRQGQLRFPTAERMGSPAAGAHAVLDTAERQLHEYLAAEREDFELPLAPVGTDFQRAVCAALTSIPRGSTTPSGALARALGRPRAAQAVGAAVGSNPLSIVVPCHRVVGSSGAMTGYAGGIETKQALLLLEGALLA
ncbi:MAG: methylated-DNA--[protein]-cysteine S-methyltransferase [Brachybacterium sp.]